MPAPDKLDLDSNTDDRDTDNEKSQSHKSKSSSKCPYQSLLRQRTSPTSPANSSKSVLVPQDQHAPSLMPSTSPVSKKTSVRGSSRETASSATSVPSPMSSPARACPWTEKIRSQPNWRPMAPPPVGGMPRAQKVQRRTVTSSALAHPNSSSGPSLNARTGLLSGSTAPMRTSSSRPPMAMTLKATPSAPAPTIKDTDFPSFILPNDADGHKPSIISPSITTEPTSTKQETLDEQQDTPPSDLLSMSSSPIRPRNPSPPTLPLNVPSTLRRPVLSADAADLGPIGSPPRGSLPTHSPISSVDSPQNTGIPSTFHAHTSLLTESRNRLGTGAGVPSSLGHANAQMWKTDIGPVPTQAITSPRIAVRISGDRDVLDEDLEEFLPSSLTDLLTPSERSRRMSRTHSNSSRPANLNDTPSPLANLPQTQSHHANHRYSRSVPAPSLLGDVKSIWAERSLTTNGVPASPDKHSFAVGPIGSGTPSSLKSSNGLGALNLGHMTPSGAATGIFRDDSHSPSSSLLAPSNASAAFLPGLHHYYSKMNSGSTNGRAPNAGLALGAGLGLSGLSRSPLSHAPIHGPAVDEGRNGGNNGTTIGLGLGDATSPSIRALQSHAPGQSLPQGLAAGYSRIHALPHTGSPSSLGGSSVGGGAFSPGHGPVPFGINAGHGQDWHLQSNQAHAMLGDAIAVSQLALSAHHEATAPMSALESMFSRLPPPSGGTPLRTPPHSASNNRNWHTQNMLSPLSRPISDDDELFSMDPH
ncbi:hypothetical protein JVU11DRAFT_5720 [Chiua virens]|nr:hypothetical protein JVU11DRAFT_5720 [Chiua virens]